jgi:Skp family chaperone for outer membrane proteins
MNIARSLTFGRFLIPGAAALAFAVGLMASHVQSAPTGIGVVYMDRNALFNESKAGQDVAKQIGALKKSMEDDLGKKNDALTLAEDQLRNQQSLLSQDAWQAKVKEAQDKRMAFQHEADDKQRQLQSAILSAQAKIWQAAGPLLDDLLKEKQAAIMIDRAAVVRGTTDIDVTAAAIERLNQKMPALKVDLPAPQAAAAAGGKPQQKAPGQ